jgi:hypothetical protein
VPRFSLPKKAALVVLGVVVASVALYPSTAGATVPSWTNPCSGDLDVAACERLTFIAETEDANAGKLDAITAALAAPVSVTCDATCASSATTATLSDDDHHRLDLMWWGVWALVGLAFVSIIAAPWYRAWGIEGKMGPG